MKLTLAALVLSLCACDNEAGLSKSETVLVRALDGSGRCFVLREKGGGYTSVYATPCPDHETRASTLSVGAQ